ncbi:hypothetical protein M0813_07947 [Anaeramoeba flamelloides]|uniref:C3H1-type domain-containing protein n=1 Tax=Anaeramoeba flamelloides TaxID=1746091 RepID=A0ABQ8X9G8_9EUKA|nr:hypothetical protein M0813_07947 [Anaeramoeba flamelloides]
MTQRFNTYIFDSLDLLSYHIKKIYSYFEAFYGKNYWQNIRNTASRNATIKHLEQHSKLIYTNYKSYCPKFAKTGKCPNRKTCPYKNHSQTDCWLTLGRTIDYNNRFRRNITLEQQMHLDSAHLLKLVYYELCVHHIDKKKCAFSKIFKKKYFDAAYFLVKHKVRNEVSHNNDLKVLGKKSFDQANILLEMFQIESEIEFKTDYQRASLPVITSYFVGRIKETEKMIKMIHHQEDGRIILVTGKRDSGKRSFSVTACQEILKSHSEHFPHGSFYIDLHENTEDSIDNFWEDMCQNVIQKDSKKKRDELLHKLHAVMIFNIDDVYNKNFLQFLDSCVKKIPKSTFIIFSDLHFAERLIPRKIQVIHLNPFTVEESIQLFRSFLSEECEKSLGNYDLSQDPLFQYLDGKISAIRISARIFTEEVSLWKVMSPKKALNALLIKLRENNLDNQIFSAIHLSIATLFQKNARLIRDLNFLSFFPRGCFTSDLESIYTLQDKQEIRYLTSINLFSARKVNLDQVRKRLYVDNPQHKIYLLKVAPIVINYLIALRNQLLLPEQIDVIKFKIKNMYISAIDLMWEKCKKKNLSVWFKYHFNNLILWFVKRDSTQFPPILIKVFEILYSENINLFFLYQIRFERICKNEVVLAHFYHNYFIPKLIKNNHLQMSIKSIDSIILKISNRCNGHIKKGINLTNIPDALSITQWNDSLYKIWNLVFQKKSQIALKDLKSLYKDILNFNKEISKK